MLRTLLLVLVAGFCLDANAQQERTTIVKQKLQVQQPAMQLHDYKRNSISGNEPGTAARPEDIQAAVAQRSSSAVGTKIGETTYDLQTNSGVCRRVAVGNDGSVHAMWTRSVTFDDVASDRGTGYNVWDGTEWGPMPEERIEPDGLRTGWPNIGITSTGRLFSITHTGSQGMNFCYKDPESVWTNKIVGEENGDVDGVWARVGVDGDNIHVVISRLGTFFAGMEGGLAYFRSTDGGDTWEGPTELEDIDVYYPTISADDYFVDVNGESVGIFIGGYAHQIVMYRSDDNGDSWEVTIIQETSNPLIPTTTAAPDGSSLDPVAVSQGCVTGLIDDNGLAHVAFDRCYNFRDADSEPGAGGPFYSPNSAAIMYWNENMDSPEVIGKTVRQDNDQNGSTSLDVTAAIGYEQQSYSSIVGQTTMGIDEDGTVYVAYMTTQDGHIAREATAALEGRLFCDIHIVKSTDEGASWEGPLNVTDSDDEEDVFPSIARDVVDGTVHLIYQTDIFTGTAMQNTNQQGQDDFVINDIMHVAIDVNDIVDPDPIVNTFPEIYLRSVPSFALQGCEVGGDEFAIHCLDYPDGEIPNGDIVIGGTVDIDTPNPTGEGYNWELSVTDMDDNTRVDDLSGSFDPLPEIEVFAELAPVLYGEPIEFIDEGDVIVFDSYFDTFDTIDVVQGTEYVDLGVDFLRYIDDGSGTPSLIFGLDLGCPPTVTIDNPVDTETIGEYVVTYSAETQTGLQAEDLTRVVNVIVEDLTPPVLEVYENDSILLENGDEIVVNVVSSGDWGGLDFFASDNVGGIITDQVVVGGDEVDITNIGSYDVIYTVADDAGNEAEITITITVEDSEPPQIALSPTTLVLACEQPYTPSFTAFDNVDGNLSGDVTYTVANDNGDTLPDVCITWSDTYFVTFTVTDSNGNEGTAVQTVIIPENPNPCFVLDCLVGVEDDVLANSIGIYPNPTQGNIYVDLGTATKATVNVFNTAGQLVTTANNEGNSSMMIKLTNQAAGVYFVQVTTAEGTASKKVVLEK